MFGFSIDVMSIIEEGPEILIVIPAFVFGYLFYLTGDSIFLQICLSWIVPLSFISGLLRIQGVNLDDIFKAVTILVFFIYGLCVGPLAILAALNNLLPESQEIHIYQIMAEVGGNTGDIQSNLVSEIVQGTLASTDPILLLLFIAQVISYVYLFGPILAIISGIWFYWSLKIVWKVFRWFGEYLLSHRNI